MEMCALRSFRSCMFFLTFTPRSANAPQGAYTFRRYRAQLFISFFSKFRKGKECQNLIFVKKTYA